MSQIAGKFLQNSAVTTAKIADDAVDKAKIAADVAGNGLGQNVDGSLEVKVDASTIEISADTLQLKDDGVTGAKLAPAVAGQGLVQDGSGNLDVNVGSGIQISSDAVAVDSTVIRTSGANAFAADQSMGGFKLTNLGTPTAAGDAAPKSYVDGLVQGLDAKGSVKVATTANITLSGEQTIDGVLTSASRVLVKDQSTASQNGIYVSAAGAWSRATDMDAWSEVPSAYCFVEQGTVGADTGWVCTSDQGGTLDTTSIAFVQFSSAGVITASTGLVKVGNDIRIDSSAAGSGLGFSAGVLSVNVDASTIEVNADTLRVKDSGISTAKIADDAVDKSKIAADVAGSGLGQNVDGSLEVNVDGSTLEINTDTLRVKDLGITTAKIAAAAVDENKLAASVAGAGLAGGAGSALSVNVDSSTIEINADTLRVKDLGITTAKLANDSVDKDKIAADVAGNGLGQNVDGSLEVKVDGASVKIASDQLEALKHITEVITLSAGQITAEAATLAQTPYNNKLVLAVSGLTQEPGKDFSVSGTSLRFGNAADAGLTTSDLDPSSGAAALVAGDKLVVSYHYL